MKLKEIHRPATFAWSPTPSLPLLATGTVAGALDESFSNNGQLEIWAPDFLDKNEYDLGGEGQTGPRASITTSSRFNRLAWGHAGRPRGIVVAGMENGELDIWDPSKILANADTSESLILRNKTHTGPVRGLDFNPIQTNLFSSGAVNGEIYVWDLKDPSKPYSPGTRSTKLDEITALAWNHHVQYALAASSSTGYTVVWDLRGKREVAALAYGGGTGTLAGGMQGFGTAGMGIGGRRGMSDVAWHPDNATRLVTSSEDDTSPIIMVWDLRNARAPEKILTGHEKGVLSLSWCAQDPDLLLSCGKDNRALCWNPQTSEIIGELPSADNWAFQVQWCPRNPDLFATAFFDGTIGIHSIQSTNETNQAPLPTPQPDASDIFGAPGFSRANQATLSLKHPPKWLRRPTSSSFGYGGSLVTVSNLPSVHGKTQSSVVHIRKVVTETEIVARAKSLQEAIDGDNLNALAEGKAASESSPSWKALLSLFKANSRDELITLLGFSKEEVATRVAEAVANLKAAAAERSASPTELDVTETDMRPHEPVVSFAEPERETYSDSGEGEEGEDTLDSSALGAETTPSEVSASAASDTTSATRQADSESTTTAPSLFGDDNLIGTPQMDAAADFFGSIGTARSEDNEHIRVPHHNYALDSSVAATIGSGPSSVASEVLKNNTFRIYPTDESETDQLVTKALVLGDFESAVSLCLSSDRFADAILLAAKGGPELLQRTQKAYFERRTAALPYLRLFQSIVTNDLADIVQNADLQEWQEIFVVLCTFASQEEFPSLAEQLGQRLEFQSSIMSAADEPEAEARAVSFRRNATLTYLAAGRLERLVNIWIEELAEEEKLLVADSEHLDGSRYTVHALALQTFIEKVTVFRKAINYNDPDLSMKTPLDEADVRSYKLSGLYDRYFEYADLLASQSLLKEAVAFLKLIPTEYHGSPSSPFDFTIGRDRLLKAAGASEIPARTASLPAAASRAPARVLPVASTSTAGYDYSQYAAPTQQPFGHAHPSSSAAYEPYNVSGSVFAPQAPSPYAPAPSIQSQQPYQPTAPMTYGTTHPYSSQPQNIALPQQGAVLPPPPHRHATATPSAPPQGPPLKRENGGWNDAPAVANRRTPANANGKPAAITSPFPNAPTPVTSPFSGHGGPPASLPPPPRPGSVQARPPPPPQGQRGPPPPLQQGPGPYPRMLALPLARRDLHLSTWLLLRVGCNPFRRFPGHLHRAVRMALQAAHRDQTFLRHRTVTTLRSDPQVARQGRRGRSYALRLRLGTAGLRHRAQYLNLDMDSSRQCLLNRRRHSILLLHRKRALHRAGLPPPQGPPRGITPASGASAPPAPRAKAGPPPPKYPPGDRSHITEEMRPVYTVISAQLERVKQTTPPQQKRLTEDLERRINPLFDALNCETLSKPVCEQLLVLTRAMESHDREAAIAIHMELLTRGSLTDDIGLWMSGIKQLIGRL
ncbi:Protein transport protein SEC31 [Grifola frondosa]|uniref:Protein transport protein SEC31 n=1 Tax=Grifola frondosa TaxID=5627 RepID=A0A1C7MK49_GRIFR|nr:Protein transport protein SEC31 [Grifola frondosa]